MAENNIPTMAVQSSLLHNHTLEGLNGRWEGLGMTCWWLALRLCFVLSRQSVPLMASLVFIAGELGKAVKEAGLHYGLYHSLYEWFNPKYILDKGNGFTTQTFIKVAGVWPLLSCNQHTS